jgi:uncharacterized membrane protein
MFNAIAIILHIIAINVWVGGMFFLVMVLGRAISTLEQAQQLTVWAMVLKYFFFWVWLAALTLLSTGFGMLVYRFHDFVNAPAYIFVMAFLGVLMVLVFLLMYFIFYQKFRHAIQDQSVEMARDHLRVIRILGFVNMILGLCVVIAIGGGPYIPFLRG